MGLAQEFKDRFAGLQFFLVHQVDGLAEYKSDIVVVCNQEGEDIEVFFKFLC